MRKSVKIAATAVSTDYRSPPPWSVKEEDGSFVVRDNNGQALSNVYFEAPTNDHRRRRRTGRPVIKPSVVGFA